MMIRLIPLVATMKDVLDPLGKYERTNFRIFAYFVKDDAKDA